MGCNASKDQSTADQSQTKLNDDEAKEEAAPAPTGSNQAPSSSTASATAADRDVQSAAKPVGILKQPSKSWPTCSVKSDSINDEDANDDPLTVNELNAVVKIQAVVRGNKVRATMKHEDDVGETVAEVTASGANASADAGEPTKEEMEAEFREDDKELCDAVKKIQSTFRGKATRKAAPAADVTANNNDAEAAANDEDAQVVPEEAPVSVPATPTDDLADIDLADPDLAKAASKIQAKFRVKRK